MASWSKITAGKKAKTAGQMFELLFERSCRAAGIAITRMPDGCKQVSAKKIIRVKSPFDWVISHNGQCVLIDTKTVMGDNFAHSAIDEHQVKELLMHERQGTRAGYVIWFRKPGRVLFVPSSQLFSSMRGVGSIGFEDNHVYMGHVNEVPLVGQMVFKELFAGARGVFIAPTVERANGQ